MDQSFGPNGQGKVGFKQVLKNSHALYFWFALIICVAAAVGLMISIINFKSEEEIYSSVPFTSKIPGLGKKTGKLEACPDQWYVNKMPGTGGKKTEEYYVMDGKRYEIEQFNSGYVKQNCKLTAQEVF